MIGPSGAGKSTLAAKLFDKHEIISSDEIRSELCGDFRIQTRNDEIFAEVHRRAELRISLGQRVVIDATNIKARDRKFFVDLALRMGVKLYYLVVDRTLTDKLSTGGWRLEVNGLIERHDSIFRSNLREILIGDGVATVIKHTDDFGIVRRAEITDLVNHGRFKKIMAVGDIHGNAEDTARLIELADSENAFTVYLGDVIDYGERNLEAFWMVYERVVSGKALLVWGNHERKMNMWIQAKFGATYRGKISYGMQKTLNEIKTLNISSRNAFHAAWNAMESLAKQHYVFDDLLFTHGAATVEMWNMKEHRLHGEHGQLAYFGQIDRDKPLTEDGHPHRVYDWVPLVPAGKTVVVGHAIRSESEPFVVENHHGSRVVFLDTGSGKGGKLSHIYYEV